MSRTIKITPDAEGRAYLNLYGSKIDVTDRVGKKGKGEVEAFGETYHFQVVKGGENTPVVEESSETPTETAEVPAEEASNEN